MGSDGTPVLLTVPEAAERLRMATGSLYNWVHARRVTVVHIGRHVRIPEAEIERLIRAGTRYADGQAPVKPLAAANARLRAMGGSR
jgi:excisionase family DNA binding protein